MGQKTFYTSAGDGWAQGSGTWDGAHDSVSAGFTTNYTNNYFKVGSAESSGFYISRVSLPFDTSSIPDRATITSATVRLYATSIRNEDNDGNDWINVVGTTVASETTLSAPDYSKIGSSINNPTELATRIDISTMSSGNYYTWTLNTNGLAAINKSGITKLGLRDGHDCVDHPIQNNTSNECQFASVENATVAYRPLLTVNYRVTLNQGIII